MAQATETFLFTPTSIPGCGLWLDGADPNGNGTLPAEGASISTWTDKSGNGRNGTSTGSSVPTYTNRSIRFNGNGIYSTSYSAAPANETFFIVYQFTTISADATFIAGTQLNQRIFYVSPSLGRWGYLGGIGAWGVFYTTALSAGVPYISEYTWIGSTVTPALYLNASLVGTSATGSPAVFSGTPTTSLIGSGINGVIREIIAYPTTPNSFERQQVEGYLAWKWGLQGSLPANHPFKTYRTLANRPIPTSVPNMPLTTQNIAVFNPLSISGCLLWLDARDSSTLTTTSGTGTLATFVQISPTTSTVTTTSAPPSLFSLASGTCFMNGTFINSSAGRSGFLTPRSTIGDMFAFCYDGLTCKVVTLRFTLSAGVLSVTAIGTGFGGNFLRITNNPAENEAIFATYNTTIPIATSAASAGYGVANFSLNFASVSEWRDKSPNAWHVSNASVASQPTYSAIAMNGQPALTFSSSSLGRTNTGTSALANYTVFFAVNQNAVTAELLSYLLDFLTGRLIYGYNTITGQGVGLGVFNGAWGTFPQSRTGPLVLSFICTNGGSIFVNGTSIGTIATFASIALNGAMAVGSHNNMSGFFYNGSIAEVLMYNTAFSTTQRQQVERYLAWKYNTSFLLPAEGPYVNGALVPFPFQITPFIGGLSQWLPTQIPNTQLWLDASVPSLFGLSPGTTTVTSVTDRNTPAKTLTVSGTVTYTAPIAINFTDSTGLFNVSGMPSPPYDFLFVGRALSSTATWRTLLRSAGIPGTHQFILETGSNRAGIWSGSFSQLGSSTMTPNEQALFYMSMSAANTFTGSKNGTIALSSVALTATNEFIIQIVGNSVGGTQPFGELQELVVYSGTLTTSQRQQVEGYLAWKWGLVGSLPLEHPFKFFPPPPP